MPAGEDLGIERLEPEDVDVLRPLCSWARRRRDYASCLAEPDAFCLVARRAEDAPPVHLAALGVARLELTVVARNGAARRFYARAGFDMRFVTMVRDGGRATG